MKALITALLLSIATVPANAGAEIIPPAGVPRVEFAYNKEVISAGDDAPLKIADGLFLIDVDVSEGSGDYYVIPKRKPEWLRFDPSRNQFWGHAGAGRELSEISVTVYDRQTRKLANGVLDFAREHHVKLHDAPQK
ncbi:hypothetical protein [Shinella zoogloeoides]